MEIPRGSSSSSEVVSNYSLDNEQKQEHFRSVLFFVFFYEIVSSFFRRRKKKQKVGGDYYRGCVSGLKPRVAIINCSPLWLQTVHRTVCGARRARNALGGVGRQDALRLQRFNV